MPKQCLWKNVVNKNRKSSVFSIMTERIKFSAGKSVLPLTPVMSHTGCFTTKLFQNKTASLCFWASEAGVQCILVHVGITSKAQFPEELLILSQYGIHWGIYYFDHFNHKHWLDIHLTFVPFFFLQPISESIRLNCCNFHQCYIIDLFLQNTITTNTQAGCWNCSSR